MSYFLILFFVAILLILIIIYLQFSNKIKEFFYKNKKKDKFISDDYPVLIKKNSSFNIKSYDNNKNNIDNNPFDKQINELNNNTDTNIISKQEFETFQVDEYEVKKNKKYIPYKPKLKMKND